MSGISEGGGQSPAGPVMASSANGAQLPLQLLHELHERLPVDICREIRSMVWEPLTDDTIQQAVEVARSSHPS